MKVLLVAVCAFLAASAAPSARNAEELAAIRALPALEQSEVHDQCGQYSLRYVTAEGTVVQERGRLVPNLKGDGYVLITDGEISYIGDDGKEYFTKLSAGLNGTKVEGNILPVAPEPTVPKIPEVLEVPGSETVPIVPETDSLVCEEQVPVINNTID